MDSFRLLFFHPTSLDIICKYALKGFFIAYIVIGVVYVFSVHCEGELKNGCYKHVSIEITGQRLEQKTLNVYKRCPSS